MRTFKVPVTISRNFLSPYAHQRASIRLIALRQSRQLGRRSISTQSGPKRLNSSFAVERLSPQDAERADAVLLGKGSASQRGPSSGMFHVYLNYMHEL